MPIVARGRPLLALLLLTVSPPAVAQIPSAALAGWAGWARCQVTVLGPGYTDQQTHTWTIGATGPTADGAFAVYGGTWSAVGGGSLQRSQGTQVLMAQWATNVPAMAAPLAVFARASDGRMFIQARHPQLRGRAAIQGYQQLTIGGTPQTPGKIAYESFEWAFPVIAVLPASGTTRTANGSSSTVVQGSVGVMQPAGSQATAACTWQFGQGAAAPAPPPMVVAQAVPTPPVPGTAPPPAPGSGTPLGTTANSPPPAGAPQLLSITPNAVEQGAIGTIVTLTGASTHWQQGTPVLTVTPGIGVPITKAQAQSQTSLLAQFDVQFIAVPGPQTVTVTTGTEVVTLPNAFTIVARARPALLTVTPNSGRQGDQSLAIGLTGQNTRWAQGKTTVTIGIPVIGSGIGTAPPTPQSLPVQSLTVHSATSATAVVNIPPGATPGPYWVNVWDPATSDWLKMTPGFTVTSNSSSGTATSNNPPGAPAGTIQVNTPAGPWIRGQSHTGTWMHTVSGGNGFNLMISYTLANGGVANTAWCFTQSLSSPGSCTAPDQLHDFGSPVTSARIKVTHVAANGFPSGVEAYSGSFAATEPGAGSPGPAWSDPSMDPAGAQVHLSNSANVTADPPLGVAIDVVATAPGTVQWWKFGATDDPEAPTRLLQFNASITGGPPDRIYQVDLIEDTPAGPVTRSMSLNVLAPVSNVLWSVASGTDGSKTFYVAVRHVSGAPSNQKYRLILRWRGPQWTGP